MLSIYSMEPGHLSYMDCFYWLITVQANNWITRETLVGMEIEISEGRTPQNLQNITTEVDKYWTTKGLEYSEKQVASLNSKECNHKHPKGKLSPKQISLISSWALPHPSPKSKQVGVSPVQHGTSLLDFKIPSYPCIYFSLDLEIMYLFLSGTTPLSRKHTAWKGTSLTSALLWLFGDFRAVTTHEYLENRFGWDLFSFFEGS